MAKKYLKGFSNFTLFPIVENSIEEYSVGAGVRVPAAQSLVKDIETNETNIYADDDIYSVEKSVNGETFTLTLAELDNELRALFEGGDYDDTAKEYTYSSSSVAPEFACTYRGLLGDGNYRMFRQYKAVVTKVKGDMQTKGEAGISPIVIEGKFMARAYDSKMFTIKDTAENGDLTWLDNIPAVEKN